MDRTELPAGRHRHRAQFRLWLVWVWASQAACRIGGAPADDSVSSVEEQWLEPATDARQQPEDPAPAGGDRGASADEPPASNTGNSANSGTSPSGAAGSASAPTGTAARPTGPASAAAGAGVTPALQAGSTAPSTPSTTGVDGCGQAGRIEVCDPIRNMGCSRELGMQCDVDLFASTLSGQCVFKAEPMDPAHCLNIPPTETCPPGQTCVDGDQCHKVCLCDSDCDAGDCCSTPLGDHGFKSCSKC